MEAIHLRNVDDEIPSSPVACPNEKKSFCISNASQFQDLHSLVNFPKNQIETDIESSRDLPLVTIVGDLQNSNLSSFEDQILLSQQRNNNISLKKRLKRGTVTFKPFESFRALEETVRELNCYFQSEYKKNQNKSSQLIQSDAEHRCPKVKISVQ